MRWGATPGWRARSTPHARLTSVKSLVTSSRLMTPSSSWRTRRFTFSPAPGYEPVQFAAAAGPLLPAHRRGRHVDAVPRDGADQQVPPALEADLPGLLRLTVGFPARGHCAVRFENQERRVHRRCAVGQDHRELPGRLTVVAEPFGVVHVVHVQHAQIGREFQRLGHEGPGGVTRCAVDHGQDLGAAQPDRQQRDQRGPGRRGAEVQWVESGHAGGRSKSSTTCPSGSRR